MSDVKWPKPKKKVSEATGVPRYSFRRPHPGTDEARHVLELEGRALDKCEDCGSPDPPINIHRIDGNPYNNDSQNLLVLCRNCHQDRHGPADTCGVIPWYTGTLTPSAEDEAAGIIHERRKERQIKIILDVGVFQCRRCGWRIRIEQAGSALERIATQGQVVTVEETADSIRGRGASYHDSSCSLDG